jgi:hypothetical protein
MKKKWAPNFIHGGYNRNRASPEMQSWRSMIQRCTNPNATSYPWYGGRGIKVCRRWRRFENFLADMGRRPIGRSLERRDNSRGYTPQNCYWATTAEQSLNKRNVRMLTFQGRTQCVAWWARELGISVFALRRRIDVQKWSVEKALSTPTRGAKHWKGLVGYRVEDEVESSK